MDVEYIVQFDIDNRMRCRLQIEAGRISNFTVQQESYIDKWIPIVRYDTYHNRFHKDIFRSDGTVNKKWLPEIDFDEAFRRAYNEIRTQWEKNREWFLTRQPLA
jgi:hypothetical protein